MMVQVRCQDIAWTTIILDDIVLHVRMHDLV